MRSNMKKLLSATVISTVILTGCATTSEELGADVYTADQLNTQQATTTVKIISVMPAKIAVDNTEAKRTAQVAGTIIGGLIGAAVGYQHSHPAAAFGGVAGGTVGAVAGTMVKDKVLVEGVSITYKKGKKVLTSTQAGRKCQFKPGTAVVIVTKAKETRIQPNAECPAKK